jgi:hypothetical protein
MSYNVCQNIIQQMDKSFIGQKVVVDGHQSETIDVLSEGP